MTIEIKGPFDENMHVLMQHAGYSAHSGTEELSYTKRTGPDHYPRFHAYPQETNDGFKVNLHLDMKRHSYEGFSRHQGEYDSVIVQKEAERLIAYFDAQKI